MASNFRRMLSLPSISRQSESGISSTALWLSHEISPVERSFEDGDADVLPSAVRRGSAGGVNAAAGCAARARAAAAVPRTAIMMARFGLGSDAVRAGGVCGQAAAR